MKKIFISGDSHVASITRATRKRYFDNPNYDSKFDGKQKMFLDINTKKPRHLSLTNFKEKDFEIVTLYCYYDGCDLDYSEAIDFSLIEDLNKINNEYEIFFWYGYNDIFILKNNEKEIVKKYLKILIDNFLKQKIQIIYPLLTNHIRQSYLDNYLSFCLALKEECLENGIKEPISIEKDFDHLLLNPNEYRDEKDHLKDNYYYEILKSII